MAITAVGESQTFNYTGGIQKFVVPFSGLYFLDVYGAKGGTVTKNGIYGYGGNGGRAYGYVFLRKGDILYFVVGGTGGYNGGGYGSGNGITNGGGATHISFLSGVLSTLSSFKDQILIAAGGGGGGSFAQQGDGIIIGSTGGYGGGDTGGNGIPGKSSDGGSYSTYPGTGGSQTKGGTNPYKNADGTFGLGGSTPSTSKGSAGGGGWYGGGAGNSHNAPSPGGGGSGHLGDMIIDGDMVNGVNNGNGKAIITFIKKSVPTMYLGDLSVEALLLGDREIETIRLGDIEAA